MLAQLEAVRQIESATYLYTQDHLHRSPFLCWNHLVVLVKRDYPEKRDQRGSL